MFRAIAWMAVALEGVALLAVAHGKKV